MVMFLQDLCAYAQLYKTLINFLKPTDALQGTLMKKSNIGYANNINSRR